MNGTRQLVRELKAAGLTVVYRRGGHIKVSGRGGIYFMSASPSDHRALHNARAAMRREGMLP
jgi:hypothetical protein